MTGPRLGAAREQENWRSVNRWRRTADLSPADDHRRRETWTSPAGEVHNILVTTGKPLDVQALKGVDLDEVIAYEAFLRRTAERLYGPDRSSLAECPGCGKRSAESREACRVFDVPYVVCDGCGHAYVREQPPSSELDALFSESEGHASTYTDPATLQVRLDQVVRPKVAWTLETWALVRDAPPPKTLVDVGAGAGHMVSGFREAGLSALGYEQSSASRRFAAEQLGVDLLGEDFLLAEGESADVVTMWGLLEYTSAPADFLSAARRRVAAEGMLVIEVPRFACIGTAVQGAREAVIARHLDPTTHVNCFSDESVATLLERTGFRPVAAWYFGMDAYELLVQIALRAGGPGAVDLLSEPLLGLQRAFDAALACDDLVVAAVPN